MSYVFNIQITAQLIAEDLEDAQTKFLDNPRKSQISEIIVTKELQGRAGGN